MHVNTLNAALTAGRPKETCGSIRVGFASVPSETLYRESHGTPASEPRPPEHPQEPDFVLDGSFETFEDDAPTREEIENEFRLRHREAFRRAPDYVAEAFARLTFVH